MSEAPPSRPSRRRLGSESPMASKPGAALLEVLVEKEPSSPLPVVPSSKNDKKQPPPPPLAVAMAAAMVIRNVKVRRPSPPPASMDKKEKPPAVVQVCLWALANAVFFAGNAVVSLIRNHNNPCTKSTWWFRCAKMTRAAAAEASTMWRGQLWCAAPQAVAAAVALALAGRGRRWSRWACAWALVALAATAAGHYMEGRVDRIFLGAAPGDAYLTAGAVANCVFVMLDLLGFFSLVVQIRDGREE